MALEWSNILSSSFLLVLECTSSIDTCCGLLVEASISPKAVFRGNSSYTPCTTSDISHVTRWARSTPVLKGASLPSAMKSSFPLTTSPTRTRRNLWASIQPERLRGRPETDKTRKQGGHYRRVDNMHTCNRVVNAPLAKGHAKVQRRPRYSSPMEPNMGIYLSILVYIEYKSLGRAQATYVIIRGKHWNPTVEKQCRHHTKKAARPMAQSTKYVQPVSRLKRDITPSAPVADVEQKHADTGKPWNTTPRADSRVVSHQNPSIGENVRPCTQNLYSDTSERHM